MPYRAVIACAFAAVLSVGVVVGQSDRTIQCDVVLTDYQARTFWGETIEFGDTIGEADFIVPSATFTVEAPERYAGRTVKVVFLTHDEVLPVSSDESGERYQLELPEEYFADPDGRYIRDTSVRSIVRFGRSENDSTE